jgi:hypothetical protein
MWKQVAMIQINVDSICSWRGANRLHKMNHTLVILISKSNTDAMHTISMLKFTYFFAF